jgi:nitroreductase
MELSKCIKGRRSVRVYRDMQVPKKTVEAIIEAGAWAPSGMNSQPWRFIVIEDRDTIDRLSRKTKEILLRQEWSESFKHLLLTDADTIFYGAPLLILVCVKKSEEWKSVNLLDCGLAAQNMFLKAYDMGLGSCFIGFGNFLNAEPGFLAEAGVPEDHELIAPLIFGCASEKPKPKPRNPEVIGWIRSKKPGKS